MRINLNPTNNTVTPEKVFVFLATLAFTLWLIPLMANAAIGHIQQTNQPAQYNPYLDPARYTALEIEYHKADADHDNPHYYGRPVPLGNVITVEVIGDDGERELIEATFDYLRNGSRG